MNLRKAALRKQKVNIKEHLFNFTIVNWSKYITYFEIYFSNLSLSYSLHF